MVAMPWPTPMHIVARPISRSRRAISCSSVVMIRAPEQPTGGAAALSGEQRLLKDEGSRRFYPWHPFQARRTHSPPHDRLKARADYPVAHS